nr:hypothetical protein [Brevibacterium renqingii]
MRRSCSQARHEPLRLVHEASATGHPRTYGDIRDNTEKLKILIRSHADELPQGAVFSHISAAVIHGLDPPFPAADVAEVIREGFHRIADHPDPGTTASRRGCRCSTGVQPQADTFDESGTWIARNDFRHERLPVIAEFHGVGKYYLNEKGPDRASSENHERHMRLLNAGFRIFNLVWETRQA